MNKKIIKKIFKITGNILIYLVLLVSLFTVFVVVSSKKDSDGTARIFGYEMRIISSDSMSSSKYTDVSKYDIGSLPIKSMVFIEEKPESEKKLDSWYKNLKVGDVLTFKYLYTKQEVITHRIVEIEEKDSGGYLIFLEGDNKNSENQELLKQVIDTSLDNSPNYIIGKVKGKSVVLGKFVYLLNKPVGIICLIILPCLIIIIIEIIKIINLFTKDNRKKAKETLDELNELKRKLSQLEKINGKK